MTLVDKTLIDQSHILCHCAVCDQISIGSSKVGEIMHQGVFAANALIASEESGTLCIFDGRYEEIPKKQDLFVDNDYTDNIDEMIDNPLIEEKLGVIDTRRAEKVVDDIHTSFKEPMK
jgi:hypothetical protein